jgi:hypothetical protein
MSQIVPAPNHARLKTLENFLALPLLLDWFKQHRRKKMRTLAIQGTQKKAKALELVSADSVPQVQNLPLFDIQESDSHYLLAVDLPSLPPLGTSNEASSKELKVTTGHWFADSQSPGHTLLRCLTDRKSGIQAKYQNGILWLMLPKRQAGALTVI